MAKKERRILLSLLATLAFILLHPVIGDAREITVKIPESRPAYNLKTANKYLRQVVPLIEKATGRKFNKSIPQIILADRQKIIPVLQTELKPELKNFFPNYSEEQLSAMSLQTSASLATGLLGKYGMMDGKLYLLPKNITPLMKLAKIAGKYTEPLLKLIIIHELTHALQDQEIDLTRLQRITNVDEFNAFSATLEGHAVFIQELVGREMGLTESVLELSWLLSAGAVTYEDPAQEMVKIIRATQYEQIYLGGKKFMEFQYTRGGNERLWEVIANPPVKTSMIAKPETYNPVKPVEIDYASLLEGMEKDLGGSGWQIQNIEMGQMAMRSTYAKMPEPLREEILSYLEHVQILVAQNVFPPCIVGVSIIVLTDAAISKKFVTALEELAAKNVLELQKSSLIQIEDYSAEDFSGIRADWARKISFTVYENKKPTGYPQEFIRICRDKVIIELYSINFSIEDAKIIQMAEKIFTGYQQLNKSESG